ncbi:hypothetical protein [Bifidobacterium vansinderenii]|uniref:Uncharacterized protein n=1 Tax=Bifidobacterium vansinderenii TaxID=1984871 RepID=A0A229VWA1_9BIFI|nr:hypothetical protein [Bifidobacterium vansinderenii]OXM99907.1 hypothetical protein Tam10B_1870 [Bifidobacterium vansinderenii]
MTRSRASAKQAGRQLEHQMELWLQWAFQDERIKRSRLHGAKDIGDIVNLYYAGDKVTIECKNTANSRTGTPRNVWAEFQEAMIEADNNDSPWPVLIKKRDRVTDRDWRRGGDQLAILREPDVWRLQEGCAGRYRYAEWSTPHMSRLGLIGMPCSDAFTLFNHGLPLGPE